MIPDGTGVGSRNFSNLNVGTSYMLQFGGLLSTPNVSTLNIDLVGGLTLIPIPPLYLSTLPFSVPSGLTNAAWSAQYIVTTLFASPNITVNFTMTFNNTTINRNASPVNSLSPTSPFDVRALWSTTGNTITTNFAIMTQIY